MSFTEWNVIFKEKKRAMQSSEMFRDSNQISDAG
jgi:hypothetical protein